MNNLRQLRVDFNLSQKDLADILKVSEKTILRWEKGITDIKSSKAELLAEYFNVSIPYLLGYSEIKNPFEIEEISDDILDEDFLKRIVDVIGENSIEIIKNNYKETYSTGEIDYSNLGPIRNAVMSLAHLKEEKLLLYFLALNNENKNIILSLMKNLLLK